MNSMSAAEAARMKRRRTTTAGTTTISGGNTSTATHLGALQIVQNHFVLDAKKKNTNLQLLSDEIDDIYNRNNSRSSEELRRDLRVLATKIDDTLHQYKLRRKQNLLYEEGEHIKNNSWSVELNAFVYDPHICGEATWYDKCKCDDYKCPRQGDDGAIHPSFGIPTGTEALTVVLGNTALLKEWHLLEVTNFYLGTKVDYQIRQLYLNFKSEKQMLNQNIPALIAQEDEEIDGDNRSGDAAVVGAVNVSEGLSEGVDEEMENEEEEYNEDPSSEEESTSSGEEDGGDESDDDALERWKLALSKLSADELEQHLVVYNVELRQLIATINAFIGAMELDFYANSLEFYAHHHKYFIHQLKARQLPRNSNIAFDPYQEMENHYLSAKMEGEILMLVSAVFDENVFNEEFRDLYEEVEDIRRFRFL
mmetsp:Transcript_8853/g.14606  ORF Transcript_8853/g.14606 Transcript_8853/m.14606 type:complete len:422 (+) Transcript_8853:80-1345(+)